MVFNNYCLNCGKQNASFYYFELPFCNDMCEKIYTNNKEKRRKKKKNINDLKIIALEERINILEKIYWKI